ncbi:MAG: carbamoyltransferase [Acidobacteriota bacterium]|nr:carbamoyltransferase [Acidobacteriota bacterium]
MYVLGISAYLADSSAALVKDGVLVGAIEEEKLVRKKHTGEFPRRAIEFLLTEEGVTFEDIDHVAFFFKPLPALWHRIPLILRHLPGSLDFLGSHGSEWMQMLRIQSFLRRTFNAERAKFKFHNVSHHVCHAASSFFLSPFDSSAVITVDGAGEWENTAFWHAQGTRITRLHRECFPNSLGYLYAAVTQHLGFRPNSGEGKVMGLSSYGDPRTYEAEFEKILSYNDNGRYHIDLTYFDYHRNAASIRNSKRWVSRKFIDRFGAMREPESQIEKRHEDIAAALQSAFNKVFVHMVNALHRMTGESNLCMAGGVILNSVANGYAFRRSPFRDVFIQPAAGDGGTSVGAALAVYYRYNALRRESPSPYIFTGPEFQKAEMAAAIEKKGLAYREVPAASTAARLVAEGKIVGWFQGKLEFGPRALGNRSILADPRQADMKDIINARVKFREPFRPFAPTILEERLGDYFDYAYPTPVMLLVYDVLPDKRAVIPAVTHVDGSGRVQTVSKKENPLYYDLIREFEKITGVPVVLNTSFNVRGDPIVCTPEDALECFLNSGMDHLIMADYLVSKNG